MPPVCRRRRRHGNEGCCRVRPAADRGRVSRSRVDVTRSFPFFLFFFFSNTPHRRRRTTCNAAVYYARTHGRRPVTAGSDTARETTGPAKTGSLIRKKRTSAITLCTTSHGCVTTTPSACLCNIIQRNEIFSSTIHSYRIQPLYESIFLHFPKRQYQYT